MGVCSSNAHITAVSGNMRERPIEGHSCREQASCWWGAAINSAGHVNHLNGCRWQSSIAHSAGLSGQRENRNRLQQTTAALQNTDTKPNMMLNRPRSG